MRCRWNVFNNNTQNKNTTDLHFSQNLNTELRTEFCFQWITCEGVFRRLAFQGSLFQWSRKQNNIAKRSRLATFCRTSNINLFNLNSSFRLMHKFNDQQSDDTSVMFWNICCILGFYIEFIAMTSDWSINIITGSRCFIFKNAFGNDLIV